MGVMGMLRAFSGGSRRVESSGQGRRFKRAQAARQAGVMEPLESRLLMTTLYFDTNGATAGFGVGGTWDTTTANWTTSPTGTTATQVWVDGSDAVFAGTSGGGSVSNANTISANSVRFMENGYTLTGYLNLTGGNITVDASKTATISSIITVSAPSGPDILTKLGAGTLAITGINSYPARWEETHIDAGTVQAGWSSLPVSSDLVMANVAGATLSVNSNTLVEIRSLSGGGTTGGNIVINGADGIFMLFGTGQTTTYGGVISGAGSFISAGSDLTLTGTNTYSGWTAAGGTLRLGNGGSTGSIGAGDVYMDGQLVFNRSGSVTFANNMIVSPDDPGIGSVVKQGSGTLILTGTNTYDGSTTISGGTLTASGGNAIPNTSQVILDNTAGVVFNTTNNETIGSLSGGGTTGGNVTLGAITLTVGGDNTSTTFAGVISGTNGKLTKTGTGTLTLTGENTYTGITTISGGNLQIGNGGTSGAHGTGAITNNGTLTYNQSDSFVMPDVISGTGAVTLAGSGTVTLTAANTYTGDTMISAGTLQIGNNGTTGSVSASTDITNNSQLTVNRTGTIIMANDIDGTGSLTKSGAGTLTFTGTNTYSGTTTISAGSLEIGNAGATGSIGAGAVVNNSQLFVNRTGSITIAGDISGTGTLTKQASGTLTLSGTNSYSGTTTISAGILEIGAGGGTGTLGTGATTNNAQLKFNRTGSVSYGGIISGTGALVQAGSGTTTLTGENTYSGTTSISAGTLEIGNGGSTGAHGTGAVTDNGTLIYNQSDTVTMPDIISGSGALEKKGSGTLILTTTNSYTGTTTITAGTLQLGNNGTVGALSSSTAITNNAQLVINRSNAISISNNIGGSGSLTKSGAGTLTLSGSNTYSGATNITAGTLTASGGSAIGDTSAVVMSNVAGAILNLTGSETIGSLAGGGGTGGNVTINTYTLTAGGDNTSTSYAGVISGSGGSLTKSGSGTLTLSGANTYTGSTNINVGTLAISGGSAIADSSAVVLANVASAILSLSNNETVGSIAGGGTTGGNITLGSNTLTAGGNNNATTYSGIISGTGALTKAGSGTLTLVGDNTYSGTTTINAGTIQLGNNGTTGSVAGSISASSNLKFNRSANVSFSNAISGSGVITQLGTGNVTLTNMGSHTGNLTVTSSGALTVNNVTVSIRYTNELVFVLSGTSDSVTVSQSGASLTIAANSHNYAQPAVAGGLFIYGRGTSASVTVNAVTTYTTVNTIVATNATISSNAGNTASVSAWRRSTQNFSGGGTDHSIVSFTNGANFTTSSAGANPVEHAGENPADDDLDYVQSTTRSLWGAGAAIDDVNQTSAGDCYFLASLADMASQHSDLMREFATDVGDNTYIVRFYNAGAEVYLRVDNQFPMFGTNLENFEFARPGANDTIWAAVMEKAYCFFRTGANTYDSIDAGLPSAVYVHLGMTAQTWSLTGATEAGLAAFIANRGSMGELITFGTIGPLPTPAPVLVDNHVYSVIGLYLHADGHYRFVVRNPWGLPSGKAGTPEDANGYADLTFAQVMANCFAVFTNT